MKKNMDKTFQQAINATLELTQLKQNMKLFQFSLIKISKKLKNYL